jgi:hypothetical protein
MRELFDELVSKSVIIYAIIAVAFTEALMRMTDEKITRWKCAIPSAFCIAIILSVIHSFTQSSVTWYYAIARGVKAGIVAIAGYDVFKAAVLNIPFLKKRLLKTDEK